MYSTLIEMAGAVTLLLWGLRMVRTGMERTFGARLHSILAHATRNRLLAFLTGLAITTAIQSSTATALMTAAFSSQGLISTSMALSVMLGADLGTSLVAQVFTSGVAALSPGLIVIGFLTFRFGQTNRLRAVGRLVVGLGIVLLALHLLVATTGPLRSSPVFIELLAALSSAPLLAMSIAALLALLASSSLAVVLLVLSLQASNVIGPQLTIALVLGANLGSGLLPVLATWTAGKVARRAPTGNLIMRVVGVLAALPFTAEAANGIIALTGSTGRLAVDTHLIFNMCLAVIGLPFTGLLARMLDKILPDVAKDDSAVRPRYLDTPSLEFPSIALAAATRETMRIGDLVETMLEKAATALRSSDAKLCSEIADLDDHVDELHTAVKLYVSQLSNRESLDDGEAQRAAEVLAYVINLEHAGDIIDKNLRELIAKKIKNHLSFSEDGKGEIEALFQRTLDSLHLAQTVFFERDQRLAKRLLKVKSQVRAAERASAASHLKRLSAGTPETLRTSTLHLDFLRDLSRLNTHFVSVAYSVLEQR